MNLSMQFFFANTTSPSPTGPEHDQHTTKSATVLQYYSSTADNYDVAGIIETHCRGDKMYQCIDKLKLAGWLTPASPADFSLKSETGTAAGVMIMSKSHIRASHPSNFDNSLINIGKTGYCITPDSNLTHKTIAMRGMPPIALTAYFKDSIGLTGPNSELVAK